MPDLQQSYAVLASEGTTILQDYAIPHWRTWCRWANRLNLQEQEGAQ